MSLPDLSTKINLRGLGTESPAAPLLAELLIQAVYLTHRLVMLRISALDMNPICVVNDTVKDSISQRTVVSTQLPIPTIPVDLRAEYSRRFLSAAVYEFENIFLLCFSGLQHKKLINNQERHIGVLHQDLQIISILTGRVKFHEKVGKADEVCFVVLLTSFHAESTSQISLPCARFAGNENIAVFCNVLAAGQSLNQSRFSFRPEV